MSKNYKRRGYPGKELKKKKYHVFNTYEEGRAHFTKHLDTGHETTTKHELDCQIDKLRNRSMTLNDALGSAKIQLKGQMQLLKEARKEKSIYKNKVTGLQKHIESLKKHIVAMTPDPKTMITHTALSRAIKHI